MKRSQDQYADLYPSAFDYGLTALSGVLTAYSAGMAVASQTAGYIFIVLSLLGVWISFVTVRASLSGKLTKANGFIYAVGVLAAFMLSRLLCDFIPENPFKAQIALCGALCWMLVFGSFLIWSDQTILFQAVPGIAIFGLVGCYDTYRGAVWMFFGFLLCFATLLARVDGRTMLRQAKESGYSQTGDRMDRSATELERMKAGPWRWVAGPQWALGSAFGVILFSFIGAPIIRESVQGVTINVPVQSPLSPSLQVNSANRQDMTSSRIGRGPNNNSELAVLRVTMDESRYLRTNIYQMYRDGTWFSTAAVPVGEDANTVLGRSMDRRAISAIPKWKYIPFEIEPLTSRVDTLPVPGEPVRIEPSDGVTVKVDAMLGINKPGTVPVFKGQSVVPDGSPDPTTALQDVPGLESLISTEGISPKVYDLANQVAAHGKNDFERAQLIKAEIERRAIYDLEAPAAPEGREPVEYFLFGGRRGYCDLFASSMVLMARSVGIPARYVTGYFPFTDNRDESGRFIVREADRHAWAELFFKDGGWVVFDATEGAEAAPGSERGTATHSKISNQDLIRRGIDVLIVLGVLVVVSMAVNSLRRRSKTTVRKSEVDREYIRFSEIVARSTGKPRRFDQTPAEYVEDVLGNLNGAGEQAKQITQAFERYLYSPNGITSDQLKALRNEISAFKSQVKSKPSKVA